MVFTGRMGGPEIEKASVGIEMEMLLLRNKSMGIIEIFMGELS